MQKRSSQKIEFDSTLERRNPSPLGVVSIQSSIFLTIKTFEKVKGFWQDLSFKMVEVVEASGHKGGILVLAEATFSISFSIKDCFEHMITVRMRLGGKEWVCSAMYTSQILLVWEGVFGDGETLYWGTLDGLRGLQ